MVNQQRCRRHKIQVSILCFEENIPINLILFMAYQLAWDGNITCIVLSTHKYFLLNLRRSQCIFYKVYFNTVPSKASFFYNKIPCIKWAAHILECLVGSSFLLMFANQILRRSSVNVFVNSPSSSRTLGIKKKQTFSSFSTLFVQPRTQQDATIIVF